MHRVIALAGLIAVMVGTVSASAGTLAEDASDVELHDRELSEHRENFRRFPRVRMCDLPEGLTVWHPPTNHEHGDPPPSWAIAWSCETFGHPVVFGGDEATPNENLYKHEAYKGYAFSTLADSGDKVDLYVRLHMASNPHERATRFHSYEMYARDASGSVSLLQGWLDFGPAPDNRDTHSDGPTHDLIPKYDPANHIIGWDDGNNRYYDRSFREFETGREFWYAQFSTEAGWDPVFLIDIYDPATYMNPDTEHVDPMNRELWHATGEYGLDRRVRVRWIVNGAQTLTVSGRPYLTRNTLNPRGWFCATTSGEITQLEASGPAECSEGLPQHIAPTMPTLGDTVSAASEYRHTWTCGRCSLPN